MLFIGTTGNKKPAMLSTLNVAGSLSGALRAHRSVPGVLGKLGFQFLDAGQSGSKFLGQGCGDCDDLRSADAGSCADPDPGVGIGGRLRIPSTPKGNCLAWTTVQGSFISTGSRGSRNPKDGLSRSRCRDRRPSAGGSPARGRGQWPQSWYRPQSRPPWHDPVRAGRGERAGAVLQPGLAGGDQGE